jgi:hypothetical protein
VTGALWGVGRYDGPDGPVSYEISHDEIQRDMGVASGRLAALGVGPGERVLFCSLLAEAGQWWPWIVGTMLRGGQLSCADATRADGMRVAMFCRQLRFRAVLGVNDAVLDGLADVGCAPGDAFGAVPVVGALPGAYERLVAGGLAPHRMALAGPAVALADEPLGAARADAGEWALEHDAEGRVLVTALAPRATTFTAAPTAVRGTVEGNGITWASDR